MHLKLAAIRSGSDPVAKLPGGAFHRWIEPPIACPKCEVTYNLAADWDQSNDRFFEQEATPLIQRLRKAILIDHSSHHRTTHYETSGTTVQSLTPNPIPAPIPAPTNPK